MAAAGGFEPPACSLGESRSIQLSYATAFRISSKQAHARGPSAGNGADALRRETLAKHLKRRSAPCLPKEAVRCEGFPLQHELFPAKSDGFLKIRSVAENFLDSMNCSQRNLTAY